MHFGISPYVCALNVRLFVCSVYLVFLLFEHPFGSTKERKKLITKKILSFRADVYCLYFVQVHKSTDNIRFFVLIAVNATFQRTMSMCTSIIFVVVTATAVAIAATTAVVARAKNSIWKVPKIIYVWIGIFRCDYTRSHTMMSTFFFCISLSLSPSTSLSLSFLGSLAICILFFFVFFFEFSCLVHIQVYLFLVDVLGNLDDDSRHHHH